MFTGKSGSILWLCFLPLTNICIFMELTFLFSNICLVFLYLLITSSWYFSRSQMPGGLLQILKHIAHLVIIFLATPQAHPHPSCCNLGFLIPPLICWIPFLLGPMSSYFWLYCFICWSTLSGNLLSRKGALEVYFFSYWVSLISSFFLHTWMINWVGIESFAIILKALLAQLASNP